MNWLIKILFSTIAVIACAYIVPGVEVDSFVTAIVVAIVLAVVNFLFKPLFVLLTLPITIFSFGLFLFVINAFLVLIASSFVDGFEVSGFWSALFFSLILSIINSMFSHGTD